MHDIECKDFDFKVAGDGDSRRLAGYGACFNNVDGQGDIIAPGAFKADLGSFLAGGFIGGLNHDWSNPIGRIQKASEDTKGLYFESLPLVGTAHGLDVLKLCSGPNPVITKMSIGFKVVPGGSRFIDDLAEVKTIWDQHQYMPTDQDMQRAENGVRMLDRIKVLEVSPVTIPANDRASMTMTKSAASAGFVDHSRMVASTPAEFLEGLSAFISRSESRAGARFKSGREVSAANWTAMKSVYDQHMEACGKHKSMCEQMALILDRTKPPGKDGKSDKSAVAGSAIDEAEVYAAYAAIMYATNPAFG